MASLNYSKDIERCIDYIEEHIKEPLSTEEIASVAGYSPFHFSRVFSVSREMSIMEYVRSRKLSRAAVDLFSGRRIIDIALDYGFETQGGFAKAFRKVFGYSPGEYAVRMAGYQAAGAWQEIGPYVTGPFIIRKPAFQVAGFGIETDVAHGSFTQDVASFWSRYEGENLESQMYRILEPPKHGEIGLCLPSGNNRNAVYLLGVIVNDYRNVTGDMLTVDVPQAEYAVFTTPPVNTSDDTGQEDFVHTIKGTWRFIFEQWFPASSYIYDGDKPNFEFYDERCHSRVDTVMEIYVPVVRKESGGDDRQPDMQQPEMAV